MTPHHNTITIIKKEDEPKEAKPLELNVIESDNRDLDEKTMAMNQGVEKGDPSNLKIPCMIGRKFIANANINLDLPMNVMSLAYYNAIRNQGYEHSGLTLDREKGLVTFTDGIKEVTFKTPYKDPEMDDLTSEGRDLFSSRVIFRDDDFRRGCERPSDLENGLYKDTDKLDSSYSWKIKRLDIEGSFEAEVRRTSEGVT
ncbi:hypothetical protein Tco_0927080 [Tanacetum coccineum]|uniref:Uncharacterized protein n=1 Tax=Tanacetum coccineum TaxID=301880 RepID=A0ABQ5DEG9_9ASTR